MTEDEKTCETTGDDCCCCGGGEDITGQVQSVIEEIRPMLQADGGDIELLGVNAEGVVSVRLQGACKGCPGAAMTLKMGVEKHLKEKVPAVKEVVAVQ
jgi:Fe-S cluster biogenesis protein NfuA